MGKGKPLIFLVFALGLMAAFQVKYNRANPKNFTMMPEWKGVADEQARGVFFSKDSLLEHPLFLLSDIEKSPLLYYANIHTPVCIDNICKPVTIELYWNLLGNYVGYGVQPTIPLTKYDHDEFLAADYEKLHRLLLDQHSVLERRTLNQLFDKDGVKEKQVTYKGVEVDGISGATKKEIKESVVEGALYSCYTLWHLANGEVKHTIESYLDSIYSEDLEKYFLYSQYEDYHSYALKNLKPSQFEPYISRIIEIIKISNPLTRKYILKKLPNDLLQKETVSQDLYQFFSSFDVNSKTVLINKLALAHPKVLEILAPKVASMSKNQLKSYLEFLGDNEDKQNATILGQLTKNANSNDYIYSYLIQDFLEK